MGQIRYTIPDALHQALKLRAVKEGVTLRDLIVRLLTDATKEATP